MTDKIMTESEFENMISDILDVIEEMADDWYDDLDVDVEPTRESNVLNLLFDNKTPVVINSQTPMRELWVAAPSGGYHYRLEDGVWIDTRGGLNLEEALSEIFSDATGHKIVVTLPAQA